MKPRLVIDGRMLGPVPHGFARYVGALAAGLARLDSEYPLAYEPLFLIAAGAAPRAFAGFETCETGAGFLSPLEMLEVPRVLKRLGAKAYHSPTFSSLPGCPCPWVVTVHDLNHLKFGGFGQKLYYERLLKPFVRGAGGVATVSEFSRRELAAWAGIPPESIALAHNAIDPGFQERVEARAVEAAVAELGVPKGRYFFCLSNPKPHKNLPLLVEAYAQYRQQAGEGAWELALNLKPGDLRLPQVEGLRLIGPPTDAQARALMAGAGAVVFPSTYEGFGLPPVEAACVGVPLVVSRIPPHREGLADLEQGEALWVDPADAAAWAKGLARAAAGEVLGAGVESRAKLMRRFSTLNLALSMDPLYKRVLSLGA